MTQLLSPSDLKMIADELDQVERKAEAARRLQADQAAESLKQAFMSREVAPEAPDRINKAIRRAAEDGKREVLVLRFPSTFTTDGGRRINNYEADWPSSLEGFAKTALDYYERELRPLGYTLRAEIMSFPDGMPGDVGMYLRWG